MKRILIVLISAVSVAACGGGDGIGSTGTAVAGIGGSTVIGTSSGSGSGSTTGTGTDSGDNRDSNFATADVAGALSARHQDGQTFLVWPESGIGVDYHVYRHTAPITNSNLAAATLLTDRWGPLDDNTSVNRFATEDTPGNFVISDLGLPLSDDSGLFVHTTQDNQEGAAYYAVTSVLGGLENQTVIAGANATTEPVFESVSTPRPVLTVSTNGGKGRIYTQYMDYAQWNPTLKGYAFNFAMALPGDYDPSRSYPLRVYLHAYTELHKFVEQSEFDWPVIQLFPSDPGARSGTTHSWWYGFARDHNYLTQGSTPTSGVVENFTEQRVLASVDFLIDDSEFNIDSDLTHMYGHSMGGSGSLAFGMRYPSVFSGIYASEPMTNYPASPLFQEDFTKLWGSRSTNLPIVNNGRNNSAIARYDSDGSQPTRVYDWMNHQGQLVQRRGDRFAFLMVDHGKADTTIDWQTQGAPMASVFTEARVGFSANALSGVGHTWLAFSSIVRNVWGFGFDNNDGWRYPKNLSFPGIHNASGSGSLQPAATGDDRHNNDIEWATPKNDFHQTIVDSANSYEISFRSMSVAQTADITPRNTNAFRPSAGTRCSWTATAIGNSANLGSGNATVDADQLLTVPSVSILGGSGTRLVINCP